MIRARSLPLLAAVFIGALSVLHLVDRVSLGLATCASPAACPLEIPPVRQ